MGHRATTRAYRADCLRAALQTLQEANRAVDRSKRPMPAYGFGQVWMPSRQTCEARERAAQGVEAAVVALEQSLPPRRKPADLVALIADARARLARTPRESGRSKVVS